ISCTDNGTTLSVGSLSGLNSPNASGTLSVSGNGTHTVSCTATNGLGNSGAASSAANSATFGLFVGQPNASITGQPANPTNSQSATFSFTGTGSGAGATSFQCQLDGGAFAGCTSPQSYSGLAEGTHVFAVRAADGSAQPVPAGYTWAIDTTPPQATISGG